MFSSSFSKGKPKILHNSRKHPVEDLDCVVLIKKKEKTLQYMIFGPGVGWALKVNLQQARSTLGI